MLARQVGIALATFFGASVVIFSLVHLAPMDPARFFVQFRQGGGRGEEQIRAVRAWYGLDDPKPVQYVRWMGRVVRGDLGRSVGSGREVGPEVARRIPWSLLLAGASFGLAWILAVPLAVAGARGSPLGRIADGIITAGLLVPVFLLASVLIYVFAVRLTWIPILPPFELNLMDSYLWRALILPGLSVALPLAAIMARQIRVDLRAGLAAAHETAARARGVSERRVVLTTHAVAARPLLARGLPVASLLFGAILIVEEIFGWPGMARVLVRGIVQRDITVMQGSLLALVALVVTAELVMRLLGGRGARGPDAAAADGAGTEAPVDGGLRMPGVPAPIPRLSVGARAAMGVAAVLAVAAVAAPLLGRFPPDLVLLEEIQLGPSWRHWMGTDASGRDLFSRLLHAGRMTLGLALGSSLVAVAAAGVLAALAAGSGRWTAVWRDAGAGLCRTVHAIPAFAFALAVVSVAGRAPVMMATVFALCGMAIVYPSLRAMAANALAWGFVRAGQAAGGSGLRIAERHLFPHLARPLLAAVLGLVPAMLMLEATLGFFGFSVTPTIPTWGTMLWRGREALHRGDWWLLAFPVAFVATASWGFGRVAESLRDPAPPTYVPAARLVLGQEWGAAARGVLRPTEPRFVRPAAEPITRAAEAGGGSVEGGASGGASG
jgi:peptide/nickel transport system permease protein